MRRTALAAALSLMLVAMVGGTVSAHGGRGHQPAPTFSARASTAEQGGTLWVGAKVGHATWGSTFTATAVVHFASGPVSVDLAPRVRHQHRGGHGAPVRRGHPLVAWGAVPVGADETPGDVPVDVTITYQTWVVTVHTFGHITGEAPPADPGVGGPIQIG